LRAVMQGPGRRSPVDVCNNDFANEVLILILLFKPAEERSIPSRAPEIPNQCPVVPDIATGYDVLSESLEFS